LTWNVSTLARGSLAFKACASLGVKNGGELLKYPSKHGALFGLRQIARYHAIMGHETMGNAVNKRKYRALIVERIGGAGVRALPVHGLLAPRECGGF
jgi:hypothetical protein